MKNRLILFLVLIFQLSFSQIPCISKNYTINDFVDAFIYVNNDENFKPNLSSIYISSLYDKDNGYIITITRENNDEVLINPTKINDLLFFKYHNFNLILKGNTIKDTKFLKKIISKKIISKKPEIKLAVPDNNISYDLYQWFLLFDNKMNLINFTIPEDKEKIKEIFTKFGISSISQSQ